MVLADRANVVTIVPGTITGPPLPVIVPEHLRAGITRRDWHKALGIRPEQREVFREVSAGYAIQVDRLADALVAGLAANATRYGQSMDRRYGREPLVAIWTWLRDTHPAALLRLDLHDPLVRGPQGSEQRRTADALATAEQREADAQERARLANARAEAAEGALSAARDEVRRLSEAVDSQRERETRDDARSAALLAFARGLLDEHDRTLLDGFSLGYDARDAIV